MNFIKCEHNNSKHEDCFARTEDGQCKALTNCTFTDGKCHFYKSKEQYKKENE